MVSTAGRLCVWWRTGVRAVRARSYAPSKARSQLSSTRAKLLFNSAMSSTPGPLIVNPVLPVIMSGSSAMRYTPLGISSSARFWSIAARTSLASHLAAGRISHVCGHQYVHPAPSTATAICACLLLAGAACPPQCSTQCVGLPCVQTSGVSELKGGGACLSTSDLTQVHVIGHMPRRPVCPSPLLLVRLLLLLLQRPVALVLIKLLVTPLVEPLA